MTLTEYMKEKKVNYKLVLNVQQHIYLRENLDKIQLKIKNCLY